MSIRVASPSGIIETAFHKLVARRVEVSAVETPCQGFRLISLAGLDLQERPWAPGYMVQVALGGWESRAYTPFSFDARAGVITFAGYVHGAGIGSDWLESARVGEERFVVGPRAALNLNKLTRPAIFFGDETSLSTVAALAVTPEGMRGAHCFFEVSSVDTCRALLRRLGVSCPVTLVTREADDRHFEELEPRLLERFAAAPATRGVLTGKAGSIQRLYKALRRAGVPGKQLTNLAYWAPGRKGFSGVQR
jgi:ferric-chelate reductase (NADPH)